MSKIKQLFFHPTFVKYVLTGLVVTAGELGLLYWLVQDRHWWYLPASSVSFLTSLIISFFLRKTLVFKNYLWSAWPRQLFFYALVWIIDLSLNAGMMLIMVEWLGLSYWVAQIIANIFLGLFGFVFNKLVTFKKFSRAEDLQHRRLLAAIGE